MARRIEVKGPFRHVLIGLLLLFVAGNWLVPDLLAGLTCTGGRCWRLLRSGHVERCHRNPTEHWITAEKGTYETGMFSRARRRGRDRRPRDRPDRRQRRAPSGPLPLGVLREYVWSERVRKDRAGRLRIPVPETGLYGLGLSYFAFAGDVAFDWSVN
jgi:hypothetical protein